MFATVHMLTGCAIATQERNLGLVFLLSLISHFILDALPHRDFSHKSQGKLDRSQKITIAVDLLIVFFTFIYLNYLYSFTNFWPFTFATTGAILPDVINGLKYLFPQLKRFLWYNRYTAFHDKIQWWTVGWFGYFGVQLLVVLVAIGIIFNFKFLIFNK